MLLFKTEKPSHSVNPSAVQKERSYSEKQVMKTLMFFAILAITITPTQSQDLPAFLPPVRQELVSTNSQTPSELLQAVRAAFSTNFLSAPVETNSTPALSQEEKEKKEKAGSVKRLLALNEQVQAERRAAADVAVTNGQSVALKTNTPFTATNALVKTAKPKKAGKNAPPPTFVALDSVTNYVAPQKQVEVFVYKQGLWYPTNEAQVAIRDHAIARLEGKEGSVWSNGGARATTGSQDYVVDQRPLDQGTQPAPAVAHYQTHQGNYSTASASYPTHASYPVYAEQGSYYPVPHYATYGYSYPNYAYSYPNYGYGVGAGYVSRRSLFGVSFDAVVSPSYSYGSGWVARGGHYQSHQATYPTHGDGHHHKGGRH